MELRISSELTLTVCFLFLYYYMMLDYHIIIFILDIRGVWRKEKKREVILVCFALNGLKGRGRENRGALYKRRDQLTLHLPRLEDNLFN